MGGSKGERERERDGRIQVERRMAGNDTEGYN